MSDNTVAATNTRKKVQQILNRHWQAACARYTNKTLLDQTCDEIKRIEDELVALVDQRDTLRMRHLANEPICDEYANVDLHQWAGNFAMDAGRDEPNEDDYLKAFRMAVDTAIRDGRTAPLENK